MSVLGKHVSGVWGHGLGLGLLGSLGLVAAWSRKRVPNTVVQADCSVGPCWPQRSRTSLLGRSRAPSGVVCPSVRAVPGRRRRRYGRKRVISRCNAVDATP